MKLPAKIHNGRLIISPEDKKCLIDKFEGYEFLLTAEAPKKMKTWEQLKAFHGPLLKGIQAYYRDLEGTAKPLDDIKTEVKLQFLGLRERFNSSGEPVIVNINGFPWHLKEIPSLSELTKDELSNLIDKTIKWFMEEKQWYICINPPMAHSIG